MVNINDRGLSILTWNNNISEPFKPYFNPYSSMLHGYVLAINKNILYGSKLLTFLLAKRLEYYRIVFKAVHYE